MNGKEDSGKGISQIPLLFCLLFLLLLLYSLALENVPGNVFEGCVIVFQ